ncbi:hypothetical protein FKP32DRAFT_1611813 [Trametes sanguinea]|nr:hypothetical protein FKP32DRAFT_1611813 [Trametes sanguinea]
MPRLFPSLGRSSKEHTRNAAYGQYEGYDAPQGYYDYGYAEQEAPQHRSGWSKVLSRKSTKRVRRLKFSGRNPFDMHAHAGEYRTTVEDYPEDPHNTMHGLPMDDQESFEDLLSARHSDNTVPLVQRESSLARLQQAFADHGAYAPTMSAAPSGSHGAPFYAPQPMPMGQPHVSAVNDLHEPPRVVNTPIPGPLNGMRPDIVHHSSSYPSHERSHHRHRERERSAPPPTRSHQTHPAYWDRPLDPMEEPPVVVVVEHGKHGKRDKYYIIPGGAPVIFEDENGNELTRVGDFSGRYQPPSRPRPVIVQDQYGREICRAGFSNDDHISVGSDNHSHHTSRSGRGHHSSSHRYAQDSYHHDPHYQPSRPRGGTHSSRENPEVYYVDPQNARSQRSGRSGSSSDTLVRSTPRDQQSYHSHHSSSGRSYDRPRGYGSDDRDRGREDDYYRRDHRSRRQ